jgi:5-methylcytosine-specific restriction endonuclease McrA
VATNKKHIKKIKCFAVLIAIKNGEKRIKYHYPKNKKKKYKKKQRCAICGGNENLNIHHLTYKTLGNESMGDLRVLCERCHEVSHKLIPFIKRRDGVKYNDLPNSMSKFCILKNKVKKYLHLGNENCFNKVENKNLTLL